MSRARKKPVTPEVTVVIPVYNEEGILSSSLSDLLDKLAAVDFTYEMVARAPRKLRPGDPPVTFVHGDALRRLGGFDTPALVHIVV